MLNLKNAEKNPTGQENKETDHIGLERDHIDQKKHVEKGHNLHV